MDSEYNLDFDFENLSISDFEIITKILILCPSIVNEDIIQISNEIIKRFSRNEIIFNEKDFLSIKYIYNNLRRIPNTEGQRSLIYEYYSAFLDDSPSVSPVRSPQKIEKIINPSIKVPVPVPSFMKKCKKNHID